MSKFIAVSNANGWGKSTTEIGALRIAFKNSHSKTNPDLRIMVWDCEEKAYVDGHGIAHGVLSEGREFKRDHKYKWERTGTTAILD